jgi:hypothetical protein
MTLVVSKPINCQFFNISHPILFAPQTRSYAFTGFSVKKRASNVYIKLRDDSFVSQLAFHAFTDTKVPSHRSAIALLRTRWEKDSQKKTNEWAL